MAILAAGVPERQPDRRMTVAGPLKTQAFGPDGRPTPAALGFARKHGVKVAALREIPSEKGPRMAFVGVEQGRPAAAVLPGVVTAVVRGFEFPKAMRWPQAPDTFARPIRWLVALHGPRPLRVAIGSVAAAPFTRGRRFVHSRPLPVRSADDYLATLKKAGIVIAGEERKRMIRRQADALAAAAKGRVLWDEGLLGEVSDLVEVPSAVMGSFPPESLTLPRPVLVAALQEHQRYFAVVDRADRLLPRFITVANGVRTRSVVAGNERVLKARLADARYFYREDTRRRLDDFLPALDTVVWQRGAGSLLQKTRRLEDLAVWIAGAVGAPDHAGIERAAQLSKADLVTQMVFEFPSLQGVVGGLYARAQGEAAEVVAAVSEQYRPVGPRDEIPSTLEGCVLALADKLDAIVGLFLLGHVPKGTADPYGLRRAALGCVRIVSERGWRLPFGAAVREAAGFFEGQGVGARRDVVAEVRAFFRGRLEVVFEEQGFAHDEIQAALVDFDDVVLAARRLAALATLKTRADWRATVLALSRVTNILPAGFAGGAVDAAALPGPERALYDAHEAVAQRAAALAAAGDIEVLYGLLAGLRPAIDAFFEQVLVMDQDAALRGRRLALVKRVEGSVRLFADVKALAV